MDKVYKLKEIKLIGDHTDLIYCLIQLNDKRLASCSKDRTIKIFNPSYSYNCDITINENNAIITINQLAKED